MLGVLLEAGFSPVMAARAYNLLDRYIYGFALQEASLTYGSPEEQAEVGQATLQQLPPDEYPHLARVASEFIGAGTEYGAGFEFGLELIPTASSAGRGRSARRPARARGTIDRTPVTKPHAPARCVSVRVVVVDD